MSTALNWSAPFPELSEGLAFETEWRTITDEDVQAFATLTDDHHPQHTDAAWAADSAFGEQIAHGLLVLSAAAGLVPFDPERVMALRRVSDAVFKRPVRFGDEIQVTGSVVALKPLDEDTGLVTCRWNVVGRDGKAIIRAEVEVVWR
ncbi:MAG: MaoC family dehydratase N-terminal domain-containing protein [Solirubrobacteraceae bacterium]|nr:MaoC family dehydratase N-terminal domain-containing protein [Solirubrobacteraceae bacterium]